MEFIIRPNNAFNNRTWPWSFAFLALICISIALRFAWLGYWMILPFALVDIVSVGLILYLVTRQSAYVEKLRFVDKFVEILHLQRNQDAKWTFPLHWIQVALEKPRHPWYPHRLLLGSKGEWVEIGQCLTNEERFELAQAIRVEIKRHDSVAN